MAVADGVVTGLLLDLDGLRGREPAAAEILRQRQGVIEQAAHPIILSDAEGRITGCNSAAESLFGSGWAHAGGSDQLGRASVGKECVSTCRARGSEWHYKQKKKQ